MATAGLKIRSRRTKYKSLRHTVGEPPAASRQPRHSPSLMKTVITHGARLLKLVRLLLLAGLVILHVMATVPWFGAAGPTRWLNHLECQHLEWELPLSQIALLVLAGVLGPWRWYFRVPIAAGLLFAVGYFWRSDGLSGLSNWWLIFQTAAILLVTCLLSCSGIRLCQRTDDEGRRLRFSLRGVLLVVSTVGVSLGLIQAIRTVYGEAGVPVIVAAAMLGLGSAAIFTAALWIFLGARCGLFRIAGYALFVPVVGWLACHSLNVSSAATAIDITLLFVAYGVIVAVSLLWVRLLGLRLGTYGRLTSDPPSTSSNGETDPATARVSPKMVAMGAADATESANLTATSLDYSCLT